MEDFFGFFKIAKTKSISLDFEKIQSSDYDFPGISEFTITLLLRNSKPLLKIYPNEQSFYFDFNQLRKSWGDHDQDEYEHDFQLRRPE